MKIPLLLVLVFSLASEFSTLAIPVGFSDVYDSETEFSANFNFYIQPGGSIQMNIPSSYWSGTLIFGAFSYPWYPGWLDVIDQFTVASPLGGYEMNPSADNMLLIGSSSTKPLYTLYDSVPNQFGGFDTGDLVGSVSYDGAYSIDVSGTFTLTRTGQGLPSSVPDSASTGCLATIGLLSILLAASRLPQARKSK